MPSTLRGETPMTATCPVCGHVTLPGVPCACGAAGAPRICPLVPEGPLFLSADKAGQLTHPEAAVVVAADRGEWRLHWLGPAWPAWRERVRRRQACRLASLPRVRVVEAVGGAWVVAENPVAQVPPWWDEPAADSLEEVARLAQFLRPLAAALAELHALGCLWFNFDPAALVLPFRQPDRVGFTNLDLELYPFDHPSEVLPAASGFVAPEQTGAMSARLSPATDVYRLGLFAYYWLARLLPRGFSGGGPAAFDFALPPLRAF